MKNRRLRSLLPFAAAFVLLAGLSLAPGPWAAASPLGDTAPRPTATVTPTLPPAEPTATASNTPLPPPTTAPSTPTERVQPTATTPAAPSATPQAPAPATPTTLAPPAPATAAPTITIAPPPVSAPTLAAPTVAIPGQPTAPAGTPATGQPAPPATTAPGSSPTLPAARSTPAGQPQTGQPVPTAALPPSGASGGNLLDPAAPLALEMGSAGRIVFPAGSVAAPQRLLFEAVDVSRLPAAPEGYRFGKQALRVRLLPGGEGAPVDSFLQPFTLTLAYGAEALPAEGPSALIVGYLGDSSDSWAALTADNDAQAQAMVARPRWPGTYALLIRSARASPLQNPGVAGAILPVALATALLTFAVGLLLWRVRSR